MCCHQIDSFILNNRYLAASLRLYMVGKNRRKREIHMVKNPLPNQKCENKMKRNVLIAKSGIESLAITIACNLFQHAIGEIYL